ncbi:hypothetical protein [Streptomyces yokosukanensis]|nr:hypothetical protein [Streptomyces yokosukanensis]
MTDRGEPDDGAFLPELCDLCGEISDDTKVSALVPDSSAIHGHDPKLDGKRRLTVRSSEHMAALIDAYEQRPFVDAELWAGKIGRAIEAHLTNRDATFMTCNVLHSVRVLKDLGGIPGHGNQRTARDAGCRRDHENPEH